MSKFQEGYILICQCNGQTKKINNEEKIQQVKNILIESFKAFVESDRQEKISDELCDKALLMIKNENLDIDIDALMFETAQKVLKDGGKI